MKRTITLIILLAITIISLGLAVVLQGKTLVEWWKPVAICLIPAVIVGLTAANAMRRLTGRNRRWLNAAAMSVLSFSLILGAFYTINFCKTTGSSAVTYHAEVIQKFTRERYDMKRVGRRTVRGKKHKVYNVVIELPGASMKKFAVSSRQYAQTRVGQRLKVEVRNGLFGLPVIKDVKFPAVKGPVKKRRINHIN